MPDHPKPDRRALGLDALRDRSFHCVGHAERLAAIEERVRAFYRSPTGRREEGAEAVLGFVPRELARRRAVEARAAGRLSAAVAKGRGVS